MKTGLLTIVALMAVVASAAGLDLNGSWDFRFEEGRSLEEATRSDFAATGKMTVPGCYDMMPDNYCKRGTGLYRRTFTLNAPVENAWLVIDGMGLRGEFRIDGKSLGVHPYPYARLELPTGPLAAGEHELFAALDNRFDWDTLKLARPYYDFYCYGGFYHGVSLSFESQKLFVRTRDYCKGEVEIELVGLGGGDEERVLVFDGKNEVRTRFVGGCTRVRVPDFKLWSPESPNLHTVELKSSSQTVTRGPKARFGIRSIEVRERKLWLNGKELYLCGANRHEAHPTFGAATPEALMLTDIQNLKAMGGNFFRGAHYQQAQRFLDLCDEEGVLVWEESLGWGNGSHSPMAMCELTNTTFRAQQVVQTREMVRASLNHPSVIISGFMNEFQSGSTEGRTLADELIETIRSEDTGHLVTFACCHLESEISCTNVDLIAFNTYPAWCDGGDASSTDHLAGLISNRVNEIVGIFRNRYPDKPILVSEMGTCGVYGHHDSASAQWTEEFQTEYVGDVCRAVLAHPDLVGLAIWQFTDARSYHREGAQLRSKPFAENLAGLYDGYRRPKQVVKVVSEAFRRRMAR